MSSIMRPDLVNADTPEVCDFLVAKGFTRVEARLTADGMVITVPDADTTAIEAAMSNFVPTAGIGEYVSPLPDEVRTHLQHLRDYIAKDPASITNAESVHVIKDLIRAVHFLNNRLASEG